MSDVVILLTEIFLCVQLDEDFNIIPFELPFSEFIFFAEHWLEKNPAAMLFFSFGEADLKLVKEFSQHPISTTENVEYKIFSSLKDLHSNLRMHSGSFAGNDSGPSHMAAMLGLTWFFLLEQKNAA